MGLFLGPWMGFFVDFFEVFRTYVGVDLGGRQVAVAEHFLDTAQIASPVQQVGSEGVAEGVGADLLVQGGLLNPFGDD